MGSGAAHGWGSVMRKRSRIWRVGKWAGVAWCLFVASAFALSELCTIRCDQAYLRYWAALEPGVVIVGWRPVQKVKPGMLTTAVGWQVKSYLGESATISPPTSWWFQYGEYIPSMTSRVPGLPRWAGGTVTPAPAQSRGWLQIPLWSVLVIPFVAVGFVSLCVRGVAMLVHRTPPGHCRRCAYDLTLNESGRCPECGLDLGRGAMGPTLRVRRHGALGRGLLVLIVTGGLMGGLASAWFVRTGLDRYLPTAWLIDAARRGSEDAMEAVEKRVTAGEIGGRLLTDIIETGLAVQGAEKTSATTQNWIDLLATLQAGSLLTDEQSKLFKRQMVRVEMRVRPRIRRGRIAPVELVKTWRVPSGSSWQWIANVSATCGGQPLMSERILRAPGFAPIGFDLRFEPSRPAPDCYLETGNLGIGAHPFEIRTEVWVTKEMKTRVTRAGERVILPTDEPGWPVIEKMTGEIEILPREGTYGLEYLGDPETSRRVRDALEFRVLRFDYSSGAQIAIDWRLARPSPCDAWLDISWSSADKHGVGDPRGKWRIYDPAGRTQSEFSRLHDAPVDAPTLGELIWIHLQSAAELEWYGTGATRLSSELDVGAIPVRVTSGK